jgi:gluconolactonase
MRMPYISLAVFALAVTACGERAGLAPAPTAFAQLVAPEAKLEKLAGDMKFLEGPAWNPADGGYLVFSDIPANEIKKWTAKDGLTTFRAPSNNANGLIFDAKGRLVTCEHSGRRVTRTNTDGTIEVLADSYDGRKFSSPNDAAVRSDGTVWFTDPPYGIPKDQKQEQASNNVYRLDPATRALTVVVGDCDRPNGLCFSPDEKLLYVADSGKPKHIRVFTVGADGTLADGKVFCALDKGAPDGIRCDRHGDIWTSAGDGVRVYTPSGALFGTIPVPEVPANLAFGGADGRTLFITARTSLYAIPVLVQDARWR